MLVGTKMAAVCLDRNGYHQLSRLASSNASIVHGPYWRGARDLTFGNTLRQQAEERPDEFFVHSHHQQKSLTYAQTHVRSDNLAKGLIGLGTRKGDRVAVMAGNEIEYIEIFLACSKIGALCTLVNYAYSEPELHSVLSSIGVSVLLMVPRFDRYDYGQWVPRLKQNLPALENIILVQSDQQYSGETLDYEDIIQSGSHSSQNLLDIEATLDCRDVINLQFTSGSTGMPKASALTHRGLLHCARNIGETMYLEAPDRICLPVPLFHSFGIVIGVATALVAGASVVLCDRVFNIEATLESVERYKCTGIYGVTTMFVSEMNHPKFSSYDLSSLRFAIVSGSAAPEPLTRKIWSAFGMTQTHTNWGMTEAGSIVTMTRDTDTMHQRTLTSGRLFPGFSAKVVDPGTNMVVPRGSRGEIVLRGPGVQEEYFSNPPKTSEAHVVSVEDGLEWFHTGDEGLIDANGFFVITGRIKDMIIRGGENISPVEIEARLAAHPAIVQSAVIGVPDEKYGEQICAFVEAEPGAQIPTQDEITSWVRQKLAHFKAPKFVIWLGSHPKFRVWLKTGTGKLRKPDLRLIAGEILAHREGTKDKEMIMSRL